MQNFQNVAYKADNFSYRTVPGKVFVPVEQQMVSYQNIDIPDLAELEIEGEVIVIV